MNTLYRFLQIMINLTFKGLLYNAIGTVDYCLTFSNFFYDGVGHVHLPFPEQPSWTLWYEEIHDENGEA